MPSNVLDVSYSYLFKQICIERRLVIYLKYFTHIRLCYLIRPNGNYSTCLAFLDAFMYYYILYILKLI